VTSGRARADIVHFRHTIHSAKQGGSSVHVQIALFDGFDPLDVIAPYEVFYTAGELTGGGTTVELVSVEGLVGCRAGSPRSAST
jgi:putative intracellular protease/amidase